MAVKPIPEGFHTLTPHLVVRDASRAIEFYKKAFGANMLGVHKAPDGKIMHASLQIGDSMLMLNDEFPQGTPSPNSPGGGTSVSIFLYVDNVDALFNKAVSAGATVEMPLENMFWGDRFGSIKDPFGHLWSLATHIEDVTSEELEKRGKAFAAQMASSRN